MLDGDIVWSGCLQRGCGNPNMDYSTVAVLKTHAEDTSESDHDTEAVPPVEDSAQGRSPYLSFSV